MSEESQHSSGGILDVTGSTKDSTEMNDNHEAYDIDLPDLPVNSPPKDSPQRLRHHPRATTSPHSADGRTHRNTDIHRRSLRFEDGDSGDLHEDDDIRCYSNDTDVHDDNTHEQHHQACEANYTADLSFELCQSHMKYATSPDTGHAMGRHAQAEVRPAQQSPSPSNSFSEGHSVSTPHEWSAPFMNPDMSTNSMKYEHFPSNRGMTASVKRFGSFEQSNNAGSLSEGHAAEIATNRDREYTTTENDLNRTDSPQFSSQSDNASHLETALNASYVRQEALDASYVRQDALRASYVRQDSDEYTNSRRYHESLVRQKEQLPASDHWPSHELHHPPPYSEVLSHRSPSVPSMADVCRQIQRDYPHIPLPIIEQSVLAYGFPGTDSLRHGSASELSIKPTQPMNTHDQHEAQSRGASPAPEPCMPNLDYHHHSPAVAHFKQMSVTSQAEHEASAHNAHEQSAAESLALFSKLSQYGMISSSNPNSLLNAHNQHGFQRLLNTITQSLQATQNAQSIYSKDPYYLTFFDFSKAFVEVPHNLLIHKLNKFQLSEQTAKRIKE